MTVAIVAMSATVLLPVNAAQARHGGEDSGVSATAPCGRMSSALTLTSSSAGIQAAYQLGRDRKGRRWHLSMSRDGVAIASATRVARKPAGVATWRVPIAQASGVITVLARSGATSCTVSATASTAGTASGSSNASNVDSIVVSKCYTNATKTTGGELLIKASSSDPAATLRAYRPDGTLIGEVQNGGGGRYGGTVMPYQPYDPGTVTIRSSSGGSVTVPTGPFQL